MVQWRDTTVSRDGVDLAVRTWSADKSPTVILVHGYPDANHVWEKVAERLSRDFKVVAYDVRGAGNSSVPQGRAAYKLRELRDDLHAVMDAVSPNDKVHLVGHDWGSIQTWESVTDPDAENRIASYTTLSGPCLDHVGQWMKARLREQKIGVVLNQLSHSWYIGAFQLPVLAPALWKAGLAKAWPKVLRRTENTSTGGVLTIVMIVIALLIVGAGIFLFMKGKHGNSGKVFTKEAPDDGIDPDLQTNEKSIVGGKDAEGAENDSVLSR